MKQRTHAAHDDGQRRLAILIDADNAQASVIEGLLAEVAKFGLASVKRIYGDFTSQHMNQWKKVLLKHSISPVQQFAYTTGKNATDSSLIIDAMDLMYTGRFDGVCLVSSDSDFTRLAQRMREEGLTVYGFGERKTPDPFVQACDKFIYTEVLREEAPEAAPKPAVVEKPAAKPVSTAPAKVVEAKPQQVEATPATNAAGKLQVPFELLRQAIEEASDEEGWGIAAKNHANGALNPWAHMRKDLGFEFCNTVSDRNPMIAAPLRKTDCSLVSDGAAALILAADDAAGNFPRAVRFRARAQVNDYLPMARRRVVDFEGPRRAWQQALQQAGCAVHDLSLAEVHDCFTIAELLTYQAMGLAPAGQGHRQLEDGTVLRSGRLPVNASGGLKAKGHPIGATGVSMHVVSAMQLMGEAGDLQVPGATLAGVFNMGGSAVANYVSILERAR